MTSWAAVVELQDTRASKKTIACAVLQKAGMVAAMARKATGVPTGNKEGPTKMATKINETEGVRIPRTLIANLEAIPPEFVRFVEKFCHPFDVDTHPYRVDVCESAGVVVGATNIGVGRCVPCASLVV